MSLGRRLNWLRRLGAEGQAQYWCWFLKIFLFLADCDKSVTKTVDSVAFDRTVHINKGMLSSNVYISKFPKSCAFAQDLAQDQSAGCGIFFFNFFL